MAISKEQYDSFMGATIVAMRKEGIEGRPLYWFMHIDQEYPGWQDTLYKVEEALKSYTGSKMLYLCVKGSIPIAIISPHTRVVASTEDEGYLHMLYQAALQLTKQVSTFVVYSSASDTEGCGIVTKAITGAHKVPMELLENVDRYSKLGTDTFVLASRCLHQYWKDLCP